MIRLHCLGRDCGMRSIYRRLQQPRIQKPNEGFSRIQFAFRKFGHRTSDDFAEFRDDALRALSNGDHHIEMLQYCRRDVFRVNRYKHESTAVPR